MAIRRDQKEVEGVGVHGDGHGDGHAQRFEISGVVILHCRWNW